MNEGFNADQNHTNHPKFVSRLPINTHQLLGTTQELLQHLSNPSITSSQRTNHIHAIFLLLVNACYQYSTHYHPNSDDSILFQAYFELASSFFPANPQLVDQLNEVYIQLFTTIDQYLQSSQTHPEPHPTSQTTPQFTKLSSPAQFQSTHLIFLVEFFTSFHVYGAIALQDLQLHQQRELERVNTTRSLSPSPSNFTLSPLNDGLNDVSSKKSDCRLNEYDFEDEMDPDLVSIFQTLSPFKSLPSQSTPSAYPQFPPTSTISQTKHSLIRAISQTVLFLSPYLLEFCLIPAISTCIRSDFIIFNPSLPNNPQIKEKFNISQQLVYISLITTLFDFLDAFPTQSPLDQPFSTLSRQNEHISLKERIAATLKQVHNLMNLHLNLSIPTFINWYTNQQFQFIQQHSMELNTSPLKHSNQNSALSLIAADFWTTLDGFNNNTPSQAQIQRYNDEYQLFPFLSSESPILDLITARCHTINDHCHALLKNVPSNLNPNSSNSRAHSELFLLPPSLRTDPIHHTEYLTLNFNQLSNQITGRTSTTTTSNNNNNSHHDSPRANPQSISTSTTFPAPPSTISLISILYGYYTSYLLFQSPIEILTPLLASISTLLPPPTLELPKLSIQDLIPQQDILIQFSAQCCALLPCLSDNFILSRSTCQQVTHNSIHSHIHIDNEEGPNVKSFVTKAKPTHNSDYINNLSAFVRFWFISLLSVLEHDISTKRVKSLQLNPATHPIESEFDNITNVSTPQAYKTMPDVDHANGNDEFEQNEQTEQDSAPTPLDTINAIFIMLSTAHAIFVKISAALSEQRNCRITQSIVLSSYLTAITDLVTSLVNVLENFQPNANDEESNDENEREGLDGQREQDNAVSLASDQVSTLKRILSSVNEVFQTVYRTTTTNNQCDTTGLLFHRLSATILSLHTLRQSFHRINRITGSASSNTNIELVFGICFPGAEIAITNSNPQPQSPSPQPHPLVTTFSSISDHLSAHFPNTPLSLLFLDSIRHTIATIPHLVSTSLSNQLFSSPPQPFHQFIKQLNTSINQTSPLLLEAVESETNFPNQGNEKTIDQHSAEHQKTNSKSQIDSDSNIHQMYSTNCSNFYHSALKSTTRSLFTTAISMRSVYIQLITGDIKAIFHHFLAILFDLQTTLQSLLLLEQFIQKETTFTSEQLHRDENPLTSLFMIQYGENEQSEDSNTPCDQLLALSITTFQLTYRINHLISLFMSSLSTLQSTILQYWSLFELLKDEGLQGGDMNRDAEEELAEFVKQAARTIYAVILPSYESIFTTYANVHHATRGNNESSNHCQTTAPTMPETTPSPHSPSPYPQNAQNALKFIPILPQTQLLLTTGTFFTVIQNVQKAESPAIDLTDSAHPASSKPHKSASTGKVAVSEQIGTILTNLINDSLTSTILSHSLATLISSPLFGNPHSSSTINTPPQSPFEPFPLQNSQQSSQQSTPSHQPSTIHQLDRFLQHMILSVQSASDYANANHLLPSTSSYQLADTSLSVLMSIEFLQLSRIESVLSKINASLESNKKITQINFSHTKPPTNLLNQPFTIFTTPLDQLTLSIITTKLPLDHTYYKSMLQQLLPLFYHLISVIFPSIPIPLLSQSISSTNFNPTTTTTTTTTTIPPTLFQHHLTKFPTSSLFPTLQPLSSQFISLPDHLGLSTRSDAYELLLTIQFNHLFKFNYKVQRHFESPFLATDLSLQSIEDDQLFSAFQMHRLYYNSFLKAQQTNQHQNQARLKKELTAKTDLATLTTTPASTMTETTNATNHTDSPTGSQTTPIQSQNTTIVKISMEDLIKEEHHSDLLIKNYYQSARQRNKTLRSKIRATFRSGNQADVNDTGVYELKSELKQEMSTVDSHSKLSAQPPSTPTSHVYFHILEDDYYNSDDEDVAKNRSILLNSLQFHDDSLAHWDDGGHQLKLANYVKAAALAMQYGGDFGEFGEYGEENGISGPSSMTLNELRYYSAISRSKQLRRHINASRLHHGKPLSTRSQTFDLLLNHDDDGDVKYHHVLNIYNELTAGSSLLCNSELSNTTVPSLYYNSQSFTNLFPSSSQRLEQHAFRVNQSATSLHDTISKTISVNVDRATVTNSLFISMMYSYQRLNAAELTSTLRAFSSQHIQQLCNQQTIPAPRFNPNSSLHKYHYLETITMTTSSTVHYHLFTHTHALLARLNENVLQYQLFHQVYSRLNQEYAQLQHQWQLAQSKSHQSRQTVPTNRHSLGSTTSSTKPSTKHTSRSSLQPTSTKSPNKASHDIDENENSTTSTHTLPNDLHYQHLHAQLSNKHLTPQELDYLLYQHRVKIFFCLFWLIGSINQFTSLSTQLFTSIKSIEIFLLHNLDYSNLFETLLARTASTRSPSPQNSTFFSTLSCLSSKSLSPSSEPCLQCISAMEPTTLSDPPQPQLFHAKKLTSTFLSLISHSFEPRGFPPHHPLNASSNTFSYSSQLFFRALRLEILDVQSLLLKSCLSYISDSRHHLHFIAQYQYNHLKDVNSVKLLYGSTLNLFHLYITPDISQSTSSTSASFPPQQHTHVELLSKLESIYESNSIDLLATRLQHFQPRNLLSYQLFQAITCFKLFSSNLPHQEQSPLALPSKFPKQPPQVTQPNFSILRHIVSSILTLTFCHIVNRFEFISSIISLPTHIPPPASPNLNSPSLSSNLVFAKIAANQIDSPQILQLTVYLLSAIHFLVQLPGTPATSIYTPRGREFEHFSQNSTQNQTQKRHLSKRVSFQADQSSTSSENSGTSSTSTATTITSTSTVISTDIPTHCQYECRFDLPIIPMVESLATAHVDQFMQNNQAMFYPQLHTTVAVGVDQEYLVSIPQREIEAVVKAFMLFILATNYLHTFYLINFQSILHSTLPSSSSQLAVVATPTPPPSTPYTPNQFDTINIILNLTAQSSLLTSLSHNLDAMVQLVTVNGLKAPLFTRSINPSISLFEQSGVKSTQTIIAFIRVIAELFPIILLQILDTNTTRNHNLDLYQQLCLQLHSPSNSNISSPHSTSITPLLSALAINNTHHHLTLSHKNNIICHYFKRFFLEFQAQSTTFLSKEGEVQRPPGSTRTALNKSMRVKGGDDGQDLEEQHVRRDDDDDGDDDDDDDDDTFFSNQHDHHTINDGDHYSLSLDDSISYLPIDNSYQFPLNLKQSMLKASFSPFSISNIVSPFNNLLPQFPVLESSALNHIYSTLVTLSCLTKPAPQQGLERGKSSKPVPATISSKIDEDLLFTESLLSISSLYSNLPPVLLQSSLFDADPIKSKVPSSQKLQPHHHLLHELPKLFNTNNHNNTNTNTNTNNDIIMYAHFYTQIMQVAQVPITLSSSSSSSSHGSHRSNTQQDQMKEIVYTIYKQHKYYKSRYDLFVESQRESHQESQEEEEYKDLQKRKSKTNDIQDFRDFSVPQHTIFPFWRSLRRLVHTASAIPRKASLIQYIEKSINFYISISRYTHAQKLFRQKHSMARKPTDADEKLIKSMMSQLTHVKRPNRNELTQTITTEYRRLLPQLPFILALNNFNIDNLQEVQEIISTLITATHSPNQFHRIISTNVFAAQNSNLATNQIQQHSLFKLENLSETFKKPTSHIDLTSTLSRHSAKDSKGEQNLALAAKERENAIFNTNSHSTSKPPLPSDLVSYLNIVSNLWLHFLPMHPHCNSSADLSMTDVLSMQTRQRQSLSSHFTFTPRKIALFTHLNAQKSNQPVAPHQLANLLTEVYNYPDTLLNDGNKTAYSDVFTQYPMSVVFRSISAPSLPSFPNGEVVDGFDGNGEVRTQSQRNHQTNHSQPQTPSTSAALSKPGRRRIQPVLETPTTSLQPPTRRHITPSTRANQLTELIDELIEDSMSPTNSHTHSIHSSTRSRLSIQSHSSFDHDRFELDGLDSQQDYDYTHTKGFEDDDIVEFETAFAQQMSKDNTIYPHDNINVQNEAVYRFTSSHRYAPNGRGDFQVSIEPGYDPYESSQYNPRLLHPAHHHYNPNNYDYATQPPYQPPPPPGYPLQSTPPASVMRPPTYHQLPPVYSNHHLYPGFARSHTPVTPMYHHHQPYQQPQYHYPPQAAHPIPGTTYTYHAQQYRHLPHDSSQPHYPPQYPPSYYHNQPPPPHHRYQAQPVKRAREHEENAYDDQ